MPHAGPCCAKRSHTPEVKAVERRLPHLFRLGAHFKTQSSWTKQNSYIFSTICDVVSELTEREQYVYA